MKVTFTKQWRGHAAGTTVDLTDERGKELCKCGYCEPFAKPAAAKSASPKSSRPKRTFRKAKETSDE